MTAKVIPLCVSDEAYLDRVAERRPSIVALRGLLSPPGDPARETCETALCVMAEHLPEPPLDVEDISTLLSLGTPDSVIEEEMRARSAGPRGYATRLLHTCFGTRLQTPGGNERLYLVALMCRLQRVGQG
jgi:hypothetical protein